MEKIIVDARMISNTGIGRFISSVAQRVPSLDPLRQYYYVVPEQKVSSQMQASKNTKWLIDSAPRYTIQEHVGTWSRQLKYKPTLFHSENYIMPPRLPCASVVTVHDIIRQRMPETFYTNQDFIRRFGLSRFLQTVFISISLFGKLSKRLKHLRNFSSFDYLSSLVAPSATKSSFKIQHLYQTVMMNAVFQSVDKIITVSEFSKRDMCELFNIPESKVAVVYAGVDKVFRPIDDQANLESVRTKYKLPKEFIVYVGLWRYHKNLQGLLKAFSEVILGENNQNLYLVLVGSIDPFESHVPALIRKLGIENRVKFTGFVSDEELVHIYNMAYAAILPAFYEGFGLPAIEAMACGTPVIASDTTSLPEIIGQAGLLFNPTSSSELAQNISRIISDGNLRNYLSDVGLKRVKSFTWDNTAEQVVTIYDEVIQKRRVDTSLKLY